VVVGESMQWQVEAGRGRANRLLGRWRVRQCSMAVPGSDEERAG
jgi:hypothetical protein